MRDNTAQGNTPRITHETGGAWRTTAVLSSIKPVTPSLVHLFVADGVLCPDAGGHAGEDVRGRNDAHQRLAVVHHPHLVDAQGGHVTHDQREGVAEGAAHGAAVGQQLRMRRVQSL